MSCILVGNGSSLLDSNYGSVIDSYDNVIRFNRFKTGGFECNSGVKTTKWYINAALKDSRYVTDVICDMPPIHVTLFTWTNTYQYYIEYCDFFKARNLKHQMDYIPSTMLSEMSAYIGTSYKSWSTGAIAAWSELKCNNKISLVGFDWWSGRMKHHYCDMMEFKSSPGGHDPQIEKVFFDKLCKENRLDFIS